MTSYLVTHYYVLLWLALVFFCLAIVLLYDWYFLGLPLKGVECGRYWWHVPVLLILTASIGFVLGLGMPQLLGIGLNPSFAIMISWSVTFAIVHSLWLVWRSHS